MLALYNGAQYPVKMGTHQNGDPQVHTDFYGKMWNPRVPIFTGKWGSSHESGDLQCNTLLLSLAHLKMMPMIFAISQVLQLRMCVHTSMDDLYQKIEKSKRTETSFPISTDE